MSHKGYYEDLTHKEFGNLIVDSFAYVKDTHSHWNCTCKLCGNKCIRSVTYIKKNKNPMCQQCAKDLGNDNIKENKIKYKDGYYIVNDNILINKEDLNNILKYKRYISVNSSGYAYFRYKQADYFLHRLIMGLPTRYDNMTKLIVDHLNGNRLDNRKSNLRICRKEKNPINCKKYKNNTSGCKGVSWLKRLNKWQVVIHKNKKRIYLGVYSDLKEAITVRKEAEKKYFGEFIRNE